MIKNIKNKIYLKRIVIYSLLFSFIFLLLPFNLENGDSYLPSLNNLSAQTYGEDLRISDLPLDTSQCFTFRGGFNWAACFTVFGANISYLFLTVTSWFLWMAGEVLDFAMKYTVIEMGQNINAIDGIDAAWTAFRDLANMFFIFILLYVAISTVLGLGSIDTKKTLVYVIIFALLINFSLFFTKVIVDTTNFVATGFYSAISQDNESLSQAFMNPLKLTTTYTNKQGASALIEGVGGGDDNYASIFMIGIGGSTMIIVTAFVFLAATFMFVVRYIVLIFLMILSPLAFVSMVLPKTQSYANQWWQALINYSIFAPLFFALIWASLFVLTGGPGGAGILGDPGSASLSSGFSGKSDGSADQGAITLFFNFGIVIGLIMASLLIAQKLGMAGSSNAIGWAKKSISKTLRSPLAVGKYAGGRALGAAAKRAQSSERLRNLATSDSTIARGVGNLALDASEGAYKKTGQRDRDDRAIKKEVSRAERLGPSVAQTQKADDDLRKAEGGEGMEQAYSEIGGKAAERQKLITENEENKKSNREIDDKIKKQQQIKDSATDQSTYNTALKEIEELEKQKKPESDLGPNSEVGRLEDEIKKTREAIKANDELIEARKKRDNIRGVTTKDVESRRAKLGVSEEELKTMSSSDKETYGLKEKSSLRETRQAKYADNTTKEKPFYLPDTSRTFSYQKKPKAIKLEQKAAILKKTNASPKDIKNEKLIDAIKTGDAEKAKEVISQ